MRRVVAALAAGSAVFVAAGCSGDTGGAAELSPTAGSSASSSPSAGGSDLPHSGAPAVENPMPESVLSGDPCEALTRQQITDALGNDASQGERRDLEPVGPGCSWSAALAGDGSFTLGFNTATREGLSAVYANAKPKMGVFRELAPIEGFPAVAYKRTEDARDCTVDVGLADEYTVSITSTQSTAKEGQADSCEGTETVMSWLMGNLKEKAGGS